MGVDTNDTAEVLGTVEVQCLALSTTRGEAERLLSDAGLTGRDVGDAVLAVSELVSNACEHGSGDAVLTVAVEPAFAVVAVTNSAQEHAVAPVSEWRLPEALALTGRGLGIVSALAHRAHVAWADGKVTVRAWFRRARAQPDQAKD